MAFLVAYSSDKPLPAPKLDVVAINQAPGLRYGLGIVATKHWLKADKVVVVSNDKGSIFGHPLLAMA